MRLNRRAAIKVIDTPYRSDSEYARRLQREAQAVAQLEHPHIVTIYRYGQVRNVFYIAMQYIEGADLSTVLETYRDDGQFFAPQDISRIIREVCQALDYAHSRGVIHRDVKPSNIMLDKLGRAVLTDFGLALLTAIGTRGEVLGTPHYVSPEQSVSSAQVVPQSDLYSLGVILYEMFTGQLPFDSENLLDVAIMHVEKLPPPPQMPGKRPPATLCQRCGFGGCPGSRFGVRYSGRAPGSITLGCRVQIERTHRRNRRPKTPD
jgi:serine/threonine protein kinase